MILGGSELMAGISRFYKLSCQGLCNCAQVQTTTEKLCGGRVHIQPPILYKGYGLVPSLFSGDIMAGLCLGSL